MVTVGYSRLPRGDIGLQQVTVCCEGAYWCPRVLPGD